MTDGKDLDEFLDSLGGGCLCPGPCLANYFGAAAKQSFASSPLVVCIWGSAGIPVAILWVIAQPGWLLPITGLLIGWVTNWLALKMIFECMSPGDRSVSLAWSVPQASSRGERTCGILC